MAAQARRASSVGSGDRKGRDDRSVGNRCFQCLKINVAALCQRHGLQALVAFRSHIAFDMARREKPDVIIATACHDRMIKALRSVPEYPALLAPLTSMDRMCVNATVDLVWLQQQLELVAPVGPAAPVVAGS